MKVTGVAQTVKRVINELDRQLSGEYERRAEGIARAVEAQAAAVAA